MKGQRTGLLAGFVSMSLLRLVSAVLSFALVVYLARQMGPAALGAYALVTSVFVLLQFVPLMGLHVALTRDAAAMPERTGRQLVNGLALALPVSVIVLLGTGLAGTFMTWEQAETPRWIWIIAFAFLPTAFTTVVEAVLVGRERTGVVAAVGLLENVGRTLASLAALYAGFGLDALFVLFSAGRLLAAAAYLGMADVRNLLERRHLDPGALRELCRQIPTFFTIMLLAQLMERLSFLLLAPLAGVKALGVYAACYKLYELSLMVPRILSMLLLPRFATCLATASLGSSMPPSSRCSRRGSPRARRSPCWAPGSATTSCGSTAAATKGARCPSSSSASASSAWLSTICSRSCSW